MADHLLPEAGARPSDGRRRLRVTVAEDDEARERQAGLFTDPFEVDEASDRVGLRLRRREGRLTPRAAVRSAGTTFGTVQVPPDGNPVILMADHATLGSIWLMRPISGRR